MADIAPGSAGQMFGLCGTFASLAGIVATSSVGFIVEKTGAVAEPFTFQFVEPKTLITLETCLYVWQSL